MAKARVAATGRYVKVEAQMVKGEAETLSNGAKAVQGLGEGATGIGPPKPRYCRAYTRARLAEALPGILHRVLYEAKQGSVPHLKLLVQLSGFEGGEFVPKAKVREGKSLETLLKEDWKRAEEVRAGAAPVKEVEVWDQGWPGDKEEEIAGKGE